MTHERIRLGISACLLGEPVRFDGGHKRDPFLVESLGQFVDWVPVCPEVESGLDAPRESMRLVQADGRIRLVTNKTAQDHTTRMHGYARRRLEELADSGLFGFVLKKDSRSHRHHTITKQRQAVLVRVHSRRFRSVRVPGHCAQSFLSRHA